MSEQRRTAVVTGAGRGIGRSIAVELARAGHAVALQSRSSEQLAETVRAIEALGGTALAVPGDVTEAKAARELVDRAVSEFGPLDVAVAGAGQAISAPVMKTEPEALRHLLEVNLVSVLHLLQASVPAMPKKGSFVVIASTASVKGARYTAAYSASKHGVLGLVRSAALELSAHGITVNAVCPGWVDTPMLDAALENIGRKTGITIEEARGRIEASIPSGRVATPEDVAAMVRYVVSAPHLTGQALVIDGGESTQ